jgi:hypothetical protein
MVTQITAGGLHTCAIKPDGAAVCWGYNAFGQALVPPHNTARPVISGSPTVGSTLSASTGTWENAPTGYAYAWLRCSTNNTLASCSPITGATQASYVVAGADDGFWLRVVVTATNASGSVAQHSYGVRVPPRPLNTVRPQISDSFRVGSVVSATTGEWDNDPTAYAYAWQRCSTNNSLASCTPIGGATQATYLLTAADEGFWIRVVVTASNSAGSRSRYSLPSVQVRRLRPVNTLRPVLGGSPQVGQTLTTSTGAWDNVPAGYAYAWKRCSSVLLASCTTIDGASLSSYIVTAQDTGLYVRAYVTATNSGGSRTAYTYPSAKITNAT